MKKRSGLWLSGLCMLFSFALQAQDYSELALVHTRINSTGSARIQGMGGAQVALGGDYSTFSNPAGLGFYNRSEGALSIGTNFNSVSSNYLGNSTSDSKGNLNIPGLSLILHSDKSNGKVVSGNFGLTYTRLSNYNQSFNYSGQNNSNSLIDDFIDYSNGYYPSQYFQDGDSYYTVARLGFNNFLFGPDSYAILNGSETNYGSYITPRQPLQKESVQTSGAQSQIGVSYALNFNDFFYLGATVGFPSFKYQSKRNYSEAFTGQPISNFVLTEDISSQGSGINATIGAIIRPKDFVQFGLSVATPTSYYTIEDNYSAVMSSTWNNYDFVDVTGNRVRTLNNEQDNIDQLITDYSLSTPWRIKAGLTFFIQKKGLITGEIESVNYSKSTFTSSTDGVDMSYDNQKVKNLYHNVINVKVGGEYRIGSYRARAGFNYMPDPYSAIQNGVDNSITGFSVGAGYREAKFFVDLAGTYQTWNSSYLPYKIASAVKNQNTNANVMVTVGFTL